VVVFFSRSNDRLWLWIPPVIALVCGELDQTSPTKSTERRYVSKDKNLDAKKSQTYITHVKSEVTGFAFGRSASRRSQGIPDS